MAANRIPRHARLAADNLVNLKAECQAARDDDAAFDALFHLHIETIDGTLSKGEARTLFGLASDVKSGVIVEVGMHAGRSTTSLAYGSLAGLERPDDRMLGDPEVFRRVLVLRVEKCARNSVRARLSGRNRNFVARP